MYLPRYELESTSDRLQFRFVSTGPKGSITKIIEFSYIDDLDFWNLGFGDFNSATNTINDQVVSDNGDGRKVLATVAFAIRQFLLIRPGVSVFFTGSTEQRTRVYSWALGAYQNELTTEFQVDVVTETGDVFPFPTTEAALGFLIRLKTKEP